MKNGSWPEAYLRKEMKKMIKKASLEIYKSDTEDF